MFSEIEIIHHILLFFEITFEKNTYYIIYFEIFIHEYINHFSVHQENAYMRFPETHFFQH